MSTLAPETNRSLPRNPNSICLVRPPFFTPWAPPLGIALLKSYVERNGHTAHCIDFNVDPKLWALHKKYFSILQSGDDEGAVDGHSKLWFVLNAHLLAAVNGAGAEAASRVVRRIAPLHGIDCNATKASTLAAVVAEFYDRLQQLFDAHDFSRFSVFGTSTYTTSLAASLFLLKAVKERVRGIRTVMGGGVFFDDLALGSDNLRTLVERYPFVDHAVLGEGEMLLTRLLDGKFDGQRVITLEDLGEETLHIQDVPEPVFDDYELEMYQHLTVEGGRSCPFQCSFCSETVQWGVYRKKTHAQLADQMCSLAEKYSNNSFFMADSLMNPYIEGFSTELVKRGARLQYDGYLRADVLATDPERVARWAHSGCVRVRLGVESASARMLAIMDKCTTPDVISQALRTLSGAGIRTTTYWIVGYPGETEEDFEETLRFIDAHRESIYELEAHPFCYYPYGQVASRLYRSDSLYPDDVTDVIRFRQWEVADCDPPRHEKFRRLRRISEFAANCGIPNIYSMKMRYEAESRWFRHHPSAVEAY